MTVAIILHHSRAQASARKPESIFTIRDYEFRTALLRGFQNDGWSNSSAPLQGLRQ
jgi:hypothetical protein